MENQKGLFEKSGFFLWETFASLKLSIFLFSSIAIASIFGTLLPDQMGFMGFLNGKPEFLIKLIFFFELHDLFYSWWFNLLISLLGVNIICCSIERLPNVFKIILKKPVPPLSSMKKSSKTMLGLKSSIGEKELCSKAEIFFEGQGMKVYRNGEETSFLAEKGRWTRIGVYIVHLGFLLLITGSAIGRIFGFSGVIDIPEGEEREVVRLYKGEGSVTLPFKVGCRSFRMETYENGMPSLYESELQFKDGDHTFQKKIMVNSPFSYKGIKFIQSGYGKVLKGKVKFGVFSFEDEKPIKEFELGERESADLPDGRKFLFFAYRPNFRISNFNLGETVLGMISDGKTEKPIAIPLNRKKMHKHGGDKFYIAPISFDTRYYTSVQVNKDPGVYVVYTGFLLIILGCFVSFFIFHEKVFVFVDPDGSGGSSLAMTYMINRRMELAKERNREKLEQLKSDLAERGDS